MGKAICCDICGKFESVRDDYSTCKIMIRNGAKASGKFTDYDLCNNCLMQIFTLFDSIRNDTGQESGLTL